MKKFRVGILGATGMVGQRFITLLENHPWFSIVSLAASPQSAGKQYEVAVKGKWNMQKEIPKNIKNLIVKSVADDTNEIVKEVDFVFCALNLEKDAVKKIENQYAQAGLPVVSNNSANRFTPDIPMLMPEINPQHLALIDTQRKNRGWKTGFIVVKPNCSIQSYVSVLTALKEFKPQKVHVTSLQAISGAGKTFETWPEMLDNVIPFIGGEEEKSEKEPMRIWGSLKNNAIEIATSPIISATCIRVSAADGHMANVSVSFGKKPTRNQILTAIKNFNNPLTKLKLPSAPNPLIKYIEEDNKPQTKSDREYANGMGITMGRLREDKLFDYTFIALSHNTIRGAAGGAILTAELLAKKGYIQAK